MPEQAARGGRCRLCTANDHDALIEHIAADLWASRIDTPWEDAGGYWTRIYRELATAAVASIRH